MTDWIYPKRQRQSHSMLTGDDLSAIRKQSAPGKRDVRNTAREGMRRSSIGVGNPVLARNVCPINRLARMSRVKHRHES